MTMSSIRKPKDNPRKNTIGSESFLRSVTTGFRSRSAFAFALLPFVNSNA